MSQTPPFKGGEAGFAYWLTNKLRPSVCSGNCGLLGECGCWNILKFSPELHTMASPRNKIIGGGQMQGNCPPVPSISAIFFVTAG